jgi:pyruvate formate lyase activating enzyme
LFYDTIKSVLVKDMSTIEKYLDDRTKPGELFEHLSNSAVRCYACGHRCLIKENKRGICQMRFNQGGTLRVPWGYVAGLAADPIEKKPFFHILPGADALTFGMLGCDFHCQYCQNWFSSQVMREPACDSSISHVRDISPEQIVSIAQKNRAKIVASSYNEPLITSEWSLAIFNLAVQAGLKCVYVSNGNGTPEVLSYLQPYLTAMKIDLKTMQDKQYRQLGGVLQNVLDTIKRAYELGLWVEIVTLVVPGFNDSREELMEAARFIASISLDIPWHVTAFHPDYQMSTTQPTPTQTIIRAAEIGEEAGLKFVYAGNLRWGTSEYEQTRCPNCRTTLIERQGYSIQRYEITEAGTCPKCSSIIPGVWYATSGNARLHGSGLPRPVGK